MRTSKIQGRSLIASLSITLCLCPCPPGVFRYLVGYSAGDKDYEIHRLILGTHT